MPDEQEKCKKDAEIILKYHEIVKDKNKLGKAIKSLRKLPDIKTH